MHSEIKSTWPAAVKTKCAEASCELCVDVGINGKTLTIIDVNKYSNLVNYRVSASRCDFLIFLTNGEAVAAAVELKGGRFEHRKVFMQLQSGAKQIDDLSKEFKFKVEKFLPILLHAPVDHASQIKVLQKIKKVCFRGAEYSVIREECGGSLSNILDKSPD